MKSSYDVVSEMWPLQPGDIVVFNISHRPGALVLAAAPCTNQYCMNVVVLAKGKIDVRMGMYMGALQAILRDDGCDYGPR